MLGVFLVGVGFMAAGCGLVLGSVLLARRDQRSWTRRQWDEDGSYTYRRHHGLIGFVIFVALAAAVRWGVYGWLDHLSRHH